MKLEKLYAKSNFLVNKSTQNSLNLIRGLAAFLVMLNHLRNVFFLEYSELVNPNLLVQLLYAVTGLGHQAVIVFFVLSGLFISNSVLKLVQFKKWSWKYYIINRLTRLYVVLIPALIVGFLLDKLGMILFDYSFYPGDMGEKISIQTLIGNLLFLQGIVTPIFGSNDPLWSLSYEFWYYIIFPCIMLVIIKSKFILRIVYCVVSILLLSFVGEKVTLYFLIWLLGTLLLFVPSNSLGKITNWIMNSLILIAFLFAVFVNRFNLIQSQFMSDFLLAITFVLLLYAVIQSQHMPRISGMYTRISRFLSDISYTLYLVHFPLIIFIYAFFQKNGLERLEPSLVSMLFLILLIFIVMTYAYILFNIAEANTDRVRQLLLDKYVYKKNRAVREKAKSIG